MKRILIDIGHPAHVHYFRNFKKIMENKSNIFFVSARNRPMIHYLLKYYNIPFYNRGKGKNSIIGKILYMFYADFILLKKALSFKPDIFVSFASPYAAQVAWLLNRPSIVLDDTEHARYGHLFYKPFSSTCLNPYCFYKKFGQKQVFFNSLVEYMYLHPKYFKPDKEIYSFLGISPSEKYVILRFVSWQANHDIGQSGIDGQIKLTLIELLKKKFKIFISSEGGFSDSRLSKYAIKIPPEKMHDALYFAEFFVTESGTMASEAAILNTPVVYVNSLPLMGYLREEEKVGMLFHFTNSDGIPNKISELMNLKDIKSHFKPSNERLLEELIDPTAFLVWFIENYPESVRIMKENPVYQDRFK
jgi:predicted glycosyltransferase